jgi:hypothetical protein
MTRDDGDEVTYFRLCREIAVRLETLEKRVKEGKALHETKDFCSFLRWSGLLRLLEQHTTPPRASQLPVDGFLLRWKVERLERLTQRRMVDLGKEISIELSALESIHHKLDLIAGQVARIPVEQTNTALTVVAA